jgi:hypothetical protein
MTWHMCSNGPGNYAATVVIRSIYFTNVLIAVTCAECGVLCGITKSISVCFTYKFVAINRAERGVLCGVTASSVASGSSGAFKVLLTIQGCSTHALQLHNACSIDSTWHCHHIGIYLYTAYCLLSAYHCISQAQARASRVCKGLHTAV